MAKGRTSLVGPGGWLERDLAGTDCGVRSHLCQEGSCSQEHKLFLKFFLGLDFPDCKGCGPSSWSYPTCFNLLLENIFPKSIAFLRLVLVAELCE